MLTAILCAVALAQTGVGSLQDQPRSVFHQIGMVRTGKNGYEEYVLAVDRLMFHPNRQALNDLKDGKAGTPLSRARHASKAYFDVLALIEQGNKKPVFEPRKTLDEDALFPEYAGFKEIARVQAGLVYASLADGNSQGAADALISALEFADRFGRSVLIANLVAFANRSIVLASVDGMPMQFSQRDAKRLVSYLDALLLREPMLASGIKAEAAFMTSYLRKMAQPSTPMDAWELVTGGSELADETYARFAKEFEAMSEAQKRQTFRRAADDVEAHLRDVLNILLGPEGDWGAAMIEAGPTDVTSFIALSAMPVYSQAISAEQKTRAQLRLLRLHMLICAFRWEHRRLPETLAQLQAPEAVKDPLGGEFQYEIRSDNSYRLYSKGTKAMGEIDLVYKRPLQPSTGPIDPTALEHNNLFTLTRGRKP